MMVEAAKLLKGEYEDQQLLFDDYEEDDDQLGDGHSSEVVDEHQMQHMANSGGDAASALIPHVNESISTGDKRRRQRNFTSSEELPMGTLDMDKPKHSYWRYFRRDRVTARAECRMCGRSIQMGLKSSTGGMRRHMQSIHFGVFVEFIAERSANPRGGGAIVGVAAAPAPSTTSQQHEMMTLRKRHRGDTRHQPQQGMAFGVKTAQKTDGAKYFSPSFGFDAFCRTSPAAASAHLHATKTQMFEPGSLNDSLKMLFNNHNHHDAGDDNTEQQQQQQLYNTEGLRFMDGTDAELSNQQQNNNNATDNTTIIVNRGGGEDNDDVEQYGGHMSPPPAGTSQERLHRMVFSSTTVVSSSSNNNNINNNNYNNNAVDNGMLMQQFQQHGIPIRRVTSSSSTNDGCAAQNSVRVSSSTLASASPLRQISDGELIGRLQIARERLKDALDMIDSLQQELFIRHRRRGAGANM